MFENYTGVFLKKYIHTYLLARLFNNNKLIKKIIQIKLG